MIQNQKAASTLALSVLKCFAVWVFWSSQASAFRGYPAVIPTTNCVKVLSIAKDSEGEKLGVVPGDLITTWSQGSGGGSIPSPLDFKGIQRERAGRGPVTLHGVRLGKTISWTFKTETWGIETTPIWPGVEPVLGRLKELAKAEQWDTLAQYCRTSCMGLDVASGERGYALYRTANFFADGGKIKEANEFFGKAIDENPTYQPYFAAQVYEAWAKATDDLNDYAAAYRLFGDARQESLKLSPHSLNAAFFSLRMALAKEAEGDLQGATRLALGALSEVNLLAPRCILKVGILVNLGGIAWAKADNAAAESWLRQTVDLGSQVDPKGKPMAHAYQGLGLIAFDRGNTTDAENFLIQGLQLAKGLGSEDSLASDWEGLGDVFADAGNFPKAEFCFLRAQELAEKLGPRGESRLAEALSSLADLKRQTGEVVQATAIAKRAVSIQERVSPNSLTLVTALHTYAKLLLDKGDYSGAQDLFSKSLAIGNAVNPEGLQVADTHQHLAEVYTRKGLPTQAWNEYLLAAHIQARLAPTGSAYAETMAGLAGLAEKLGKPNTAVSYYSKALGLLDAQRSSWDPSDSIHFEATFSPMYARYVALLRTGGQTRSALEVLDHSRARTLIRTLREDHVSLQTNTPRALLEEQQRVKQRLTELSERRLELLTSGHAKRLPELDRQIAGATTEYALTETQIRTADPRYGALSQPAQVTLAQIQASLDSHTVLLEYCLGEESSYLFAASHNGLASFKLAPRAELVR